MGYQTRQKGLHTALHLKGKEVGTKILGLSFIFNSKKIGSSCHANLGIEKTGQ